jgi:hypothetical protein
MNKSDVAASRVVRPLTSRHLTLIYASLCNSLAAMNDLNRLLLGVRPDPATGETQREATPQEIDELASMFSRWGTTGEVVTPQ